MEMTLKIEGMMCGGCSGRVKKALEALPEVTSAEVSHDAGTAIVSGASLDFETLKAAVEEQGYDVIA